MAHGGEGTPVKKLLILLPHKSSQTSTSMQTEPMKATPTLKETYLHSFQNWLSAMNYVASSQYYDPRRLGDFLDWLEARGIKELANVTAKDIQHFFQDLSKRTSKKKGAVLSPSTLRNYLTSLRRFHRYLLQHTGEGLEINVQLGSVARKPPVLLSNEEIAALYEATALDLLGMRDRAMLAVCYGCGLRRQEAASLEVKDIQTERQYVHVRRAKGHKERYVPMVGMVTEDLSSYLQEARPMLIKRTNTSHAEPSALFLSIQGKPLSGSMLYERLRKLSQKAGIQKAVGLHSLRHSMATHLLARGMSLTQIAHFLGHQSLESTQIYTHVTHTHVS